MISVKLTNPSNNKVIHSFQAYNGHELLITATYIQTHGVFKAVTRTDAGTSNITTPDAGGSLILTDLIISGESQATSTVEVRFTDDTNNITIVLAGQAKTPVSIAIPFAGRIQGWKDARLDMITTGIADATVMAAYVKIRPDRTQEFAEWDKLR